MRKLIRSFILSAFVIFSATGVRAEEDPQFAAKLREMLKRTEKSIEILREQISENQSAPFIADLYLQLGELLSQRANALYYIQMERHKISSQSATATKEFNPVVEAQREAIVVFKKILAEFPKYPKRNKILFLLALTYKSIDEVAGFEDAAQKLIREFPATQEGMQGRLLLGQHHFDKNDFERASNYLVPVSKCPFVYERNLARYRMGLISLSREKHQESLSLFRAVIIDKDLKEEDNPFAVSLETKTVKSNLKREALVDSIRAYTYVFKNKADPVRYYAAIAPNETLFQEVIEKLAYRYISIKKYDQAVGLLRTLSERMSDPQKVMDIYHQVLMAIPLERRIEIPVSEIRFVLQKYNTWLNYYDMQKEVKNEAAIFFEKQVRDLGTKAHDQAKSKKSKNVGELLIKARDFYLLYLGFYPTGRNSMKMAVNLGDVYFRMGHLLKSGEYYLRAFSEEFGPPPTRMKKSLIENAILVLQKNQKYSYFDQLRVRGLLHRAIQAYMKFDEKQLRNPELMFTYIKNQYDQGFYDLALPGLYNYMKKFPAHRQAANAGEIILDHYYTKDDIASLDKWATKILALPKLTTVMRKRVEAIKSHAQLRKLKETVKMATGGDEFSQGKGYLAAALKVTDNELKSVALQQALSRSRSERDYKTFFKAAILIAQKEGKPDQKFRILMSMPQESIGMGRFYSALQQYLDISQMKGLQPPQRNEAFNSAFRMALLLRDFSHIEKMKRSAFDLTAENKKALAGFVADALESPLKTPDSFLKMALTDKEGTLLLAAYKAQFKYSRLRGNVNNAVVRHCKGRPESEVCSWLKLKKLDSPDRTFFIKKIRSAGTDLGGVEPFAQKFVQVMGTHQSFSSSRDPVLQVMVTLRLKQLFDAFSGYLMRVANANSEVKSILEKKAQESSRNAADAIQRCRTIMDSAGLYSPVNRFCESGRVPSLGEALKWAKTIPVRQANRDPAGVVFVNRQKELFVNPKNAEEYILLVRDYQKKGHVGLAAAGAAYGVSLHAEHKAELEAILGCALVQLGFYSEAAFHLTSAGSEAEAQTCRRRLEGLIQ